MFLITLICAFCCKYLRQNMMLAHTVVVCMPANPADASLLSWLLEFGSKPLWFACLLKHTKVHISISSHNNILKLIFPNLYCKSQIWKEIFVSCSNVRYIYRFHYHLRANHGKNRSKLAMTQYPPPPQKDKSNKLLSYKVCNHFKNNCWLIKIFWEDASLGNSHLWLIEWEIDMPINLGWMRTFHVFQTWIYWKVT